MAKNIKSAYRSAGASSGKYKSSLYDISNSADELNFIDKKTTWEQEKLSKRVETIGDTLSLASTLYGGYEDKQKFKGATDAVSGKYGELQDDTRNWKDKLLGKEREYTFSQDGKTNTFSKAGVSAQGGMILGESTTESSSGISGSMSEEAGISTKSGGYTTAESGQTTSYGNPTEGIGSDPSGLYQSAEDGPKTNYTAGEGQTIGYGSGDNNVRKQALKDYNTGKDPDAPKGIKGLISKVKGSFYDKRKIYNKGDDIDMPGQISKDDQTMLDSVGNGFSMEDSLNQDFTPDKSEADLRQEKRRKLIESMGLSQGNSKNNSFWEGGSKNSSYNRLSQTIELGN